jgi:DNA polymerase/3'-5' exonuclease PolX
VIQWDKNCFNLEGSQHQIWAYRKAAWTVDEHQHSIEELFQQRGDAGLQELPDIGRSISAQIARWLEE